MKKIKLSENQLFASVCLILGLITLALYWPCWKNNFISVDDFSYITLNPHVTDGRIVDNLKWAFTSTDQANWHPLTWISHMVDCRLFGLVPGAHHMMNVLFHIANTLLLLLLLKDATGAFWRSAIVAALFAWHPMHVESVCWAAERKDVLSTFFWLLSLLAYVRYTRQKSVVFYLLALVFFAAGLMSKPMVVTLPFVLCLLDWWPLNRCTRQNLVRLAVEKLPFFALTIGASLITYLAQRSGGALWHLPWLERTGIVAVAYILYVSKLICPLNLAFPYAHAVSAPTLWPYLAILLLVLWSGLAWFKAKSQPYFIVGWLYFLGTLVPAIGIVKVGSQTMADRYVYIPSIGFFVIIVWGTYDLLRSQPNWWLISTIASTCVLGICLVLSRIQIGYWHDSASLFSHTIAITEDNYLAEVWLGEVYRDEGFPKEALDCFLESVKTEPRYPPSQKDLGIELLDNGRSDEAGVHFQANVELDPYDPAAHQNFGVFLTSHGKPEQGIAQYEQALKLDPASTGVMNQLAWIYATDNQAKYRDGRRAVELAKQACESGQYGNPFFLRTLAAAYAEEGDFSEASHYLEQARIKAIAQKEKGLLDEMPRFEKAFNLKQPYRDPALP
jgi:Tfp pilus assembly protein PilF